MPEQEHAPVPVQQKKLAQGPEEEEESNSGEGEQLTDEEFLRGQGEFGAGGGGALRQK